MLCYSEDNLPGGATIFVNRAKKRQHFCQNPSPVQNWKLTLLSLSNKKNKNNKTNNLT